MPVIKSGGKLKEYNAVRFCSSSAFEFGTNNTDAESETEKLLKLMALDCFL